MCRESGIYRTSEHFPESFTSKTKNEISCVLMGGLGSGHNTSNTITGRTINALSINAFPNYKVSDFKFGILANLSFIGQNTDPATVDNQNLKGTAWDLGVGAEYEYQLWTFEVGFNFLGHYGLSNKSSSGDDVAYKKPIGFLIKAGYFVIPQVSVDASFSLISYGTGSLGNVDIDTSTNKLTETNFALGGTYHG